MLPFKNITDFLRSERMALRAILLVEPNRLNANINAFQDFRVPKENIRNMLLKESRRLIVANDLLRASLEEVRELGFDPLKITFLVASQAIRGEGESTKVRKTQILKK